VIVRLKSVEYMSVTVAGDGAESVYVRDGFVAQLPLLQDFQYKLWSRPCRHRRLPWWQGYREDGGRRRILNGYGLKVHDFVTALVNASPHTSQSASIGATSRSFPIDTVDINVAACIRPGNVGRLRNGAVFDRCIVWYTGPRRGTRIRLGNHLRLSFFIATCVRYSPSTSNLHSGGKPIG
jgi:hypothetical protein